MKLIRYIIYEIKRFIKNTAFNDLWEKVTFIILGITTYILFVSLMSQEDLKPEVFRKIVLYFFIINGPFLTYYFVLKGIDKFNFFSDKENTLLIVFNFLKYNNYSNEIIGKESAKVYPKISEKKVKKLYQKFLKKEISLYGPCRQLSIRETKLRIFVLYTLLELAADDKIYTIEEEEYIEEVSRLLRIPNRSYLILKSKFINQGLKEERKIIDEQNRKKAAESFTKSFLPYNAYKILGISPAVTKRQLKKVYRTLAKKYHPDIFYGQSEEIIQKAEDKFQEITEAYELIKKYKGL